MVCTTQNKGDDDAQPTRSGNRFRCRAALLASEHWQVHCESSSARRSLGDSTKRPQDASAELAVKLDDAQVANIVKRSYQYVAMYNVNNKAAMDDTIL